MKPEDKAQRDGQAAAGIDRIIHEPARLLILTHLYVVTEADFVFLERQTGLTRGNLSSHLSRLEEGGYVTVAKKFVERVPRTVLRLTDNGREAFSAYRDTIRAVLSTKGKQG